MPKFESARALPDEEKRNTIHNPFLTPSAVEKRHDVARRLGGDLYQAIEKATPTEFISRWSGQPETYNPSLAGKGGEHLVFEFDDPKHRDVVFKINYLKSKEVLSAWSRGPSQFKAAVEYLRDDIDEQKIRLMELRKYFGKDAVPVQRLAMRDVPISREVIERLDPKYPTAKQLPDHIPAWIAVQSKLELSKDRTVSLNGSYAEYLIARASERGKPGVEQDYDHAHDVLSGYQESGEEPLRRHEKIDRVLWAFPALDAVYTRAEEDPSFKLKLQKVVQDLLRYTRETGNALDLNGENNLVMLEQNGEWQLKMPDPLFTGSEPKMSDLEIATAALAHDEAISKEVSGKALNPLNTLRVINALALIADVPDQLKIPRMGEVSPRRWRKNLTRIFQRA